MVSLTHAIHGADSRAALRLHGRENSSVLDRTKYVFNRFVWSIKKLADDIFNQKKTITLARAALITAASIGALAAISSLIAGLPGVAILTAGSACGNVMALSVINALKFHEKNIISVKREIQAFRAANAMLHTEVVASRAENTGLREQNTILSAKAVDLSTQLQLLSNATTALQGNIENIAIQNTELTLQNANYRRIGEQFTACLEAFRSTGTIDRENFSRTMDEFTRQFAVVQEFWDRIYRDTGEFRENHNLQIAQITDLINKITDPGNTLANLKKHREIRRQIDESLTTLNAYQTHVAALAAQQNEKERQIQEHERVLAELTVAHREILAEYERQNAALRSTVEAQINHVNRIGLPESIEVCIDCDVGYGRTLGIRSEPWTETTVFSQTAGGWKGQIPVGKHFKFVIVSGANDIRWEQGSNRFVGDSSQAHNIYTSRIEV